MGKWSTYQRRGSPAPPPAEAPPPTVPDLSVACIIGTPFLTWIWAGADPDQWGIEISHDDVTFDRIEEIDGELRLYEDAAQICESGEFDAWYRIVPCDSDGEPIGDPSNSAFILLAEW
jgi:hypothetical protein